MPSQNRDGEIVLALLKAIPDLIAIYRYGSTVEGSEHPSSDVDLAILAPAPIESRRTWDLAQELAALLGCDVDLIDLRSVSTVMQMQVVSKGLAIHIGDDPARVQFENTVFSLYVRLNEERRAILDRVREGRSIYGR